MKILILAGLCVLAAPAIVSAETIVTDGPEVPQLAVFDQAMQEFMDVHDIPAGQLAVTWQGRLVFSRAYSNDAVTPTDIDTLFRVASTSKPLTATLIHRAQQDGLLSVDDTVGQYLDLSTLPGEMADPRLAGVTLRQLLEHLGGFGNPSDYGYDPVFNDPTVASRTGSGLPVRKSDILRSMNGIPLYYQPGATYAYSNYGFMLAGMILEQATGMPYHAYADSVFNPIGMRRSRLARTLEEKQYANSAHYLSGFEAPTVMDGSGAPQPLEYGGLNYDNMAAYGGWTSTATELALWLANLDDPDAPDAILDADSLARMFGLPENHAGPYNPGDYYYGSGWQVRDYGPGGRNTWHAGSLPSTNSYVARIRDGFNFAMVINRRNEQNGVGYINDFDNYIFPARNQVTQWPAHDLFASLLSPTPTDVDARYGGSWYDVSHNGEGFVIQMLDTQSAIIYWFTYDRDGRQEWYFGLGVLDGTRMVVEELLTTRGGRFGPDFDPAEVEVSTVGSLVINFHADDGAKADFLLGADSGYLELTRLSRPYATASRATAGDRKTGLWYDLSHDGEGFVVEVLPDGRVLVYWFTYDRNGNPAWMIATEPGDLENGISLPLLRPVGPHFGPGYDPADVDAQANGAVQLTISCDGPSSAVYSGGTADFPAVELDLQRLASFVEPPCE